MVAPPWPYQAVTADGVGAVTNSLAERRHSLLEFRKADRGGVAPARVAGPAAVAGQQVGNRFAAHQLTGLAAGNGDQRRAAHQVAARSHRVVVGAGAGHRQQIAGVDVDGQLDVAGDLVPASQYRPTTVTGAVAVGRCRLASATVYFAP